MFIPICRQIKTSHYRLDNALLKEEGMQPRPLHRNLVNGDWSDIFLSDKDLKRRATAKARSKARRREKTK